MIISLIIPVLNESGNIRGLWERLGTLAAALPGENFETVFVDDGSVDGTGEAVRSLECLPNLAWTLIVFSRNFGHQAAVTAGMEHASGEALVCLDADLQDPPELIPLFLEKYREGYEVVYGIRRHRKESLLLRFCFSAFYRIFNSIAERPIPRDAGDFGLVSRRVAHLMVKMPERDRLMRGLRSWVGFRQIGVSYDRPPREQGRSSYSLGRRLEGALDGLFGYSMLPIRIVFFTGVLVLVICAGYLLETGVSMWLTGDRGVVGWKSLITLAFMLGAANLVAISVVGEYVCRIYFQNKQRPLYVVERIATPAGASQSD